MARAKSTKQNIKQSNEFDIYDDKPHFDRYEPPVPITENHKRYHQLLKDSNKKIVIADGYAGTSKSISAIYFACNHVLNHEARGIVLVKEMSDDVGYLKGDLEEKYLPKVKQLLKYIECFLQCDYHTLLSNNTVIIQPLSYLQGMDYTGYIMIVDEAELITPEMMYCICSRGANRIFINGDTSPLQANNKLAKAGQSGLSFLMECMQGSKSLGKVTMDSEDDIVRDPYIKEIILTMQPKLEEFKARKNKKGK